MSAYFESIGSYVPLRRGDAWEHDDPLVLERPDLFTDASDRAVEQATKAPGERRATKRAAK